MTEQYRLTTIFPTRDIDDKCKIIETYYGDRSKAIAERDRRIKDGLHCYLQELERKVVEQFNFAALKP